MKFGDLHTHTAHSREEDNFLESRLKNYAQAKKEMPELEIIGVLDHDTLNYLEPMYRSKGRLGLELPSLLPGIEITSAFEHPKTRKLVQTHLLGYFPSLMEYDRKEIKKVNKVLKPIMVKALKGKLKKNVDIRLRYFFKNNIIPNNYSFDELKSKILEEYDQDKLFMEAQEPKSQDIINWPLNPSDKMVLDVLLEEGIISTREEGKLYVDRVNDDKIARLAEILKEKESLPKDKALEKSKRLQGSCHGDYNDDYFKISTQEAICAITKAGGIPILAHPMVSIKKFKDGIESFFKYCKEELIPLGLKGMEAYYPKQEGLTPHIIEFCQQNGLFITGGSDDHQDGRNHIGDKNSRCPIEHIEEMIKQFANINLK